MKTRNQTPKSLTKFQIPKSLTKFQIPKPQISYVRRLMMLDEEGGF